MREFWVCTNNCRKSEQPTRWESREIYRENPDTVGRFRSVCLWSSIMFVLCPVVSAGVSGKTAQSHLLEFKVSAVRISVFLRSQSSRGFRKAGTSLTANVFPKRFVCKHFPPKTRKKSASGPMQFHPQSLCFYVERLIWKKSFEGTNYWTQD